MRLSLFALVAVTVIATPSAVRAEHPTVAAGEDWTLIFDGQLRPRLNANTGLDFIGGGIGRNQTFVSQRARLGVTARHERGLSVTVRLQDVRHWGEESDTLNDFSANGFDAHEAFGVIPLGERLRLKLGRQEINLANQRLVGAVDWTQRARAFDGGRLIYEAGPVEAGILYAKLIEPDASADGHTAYPPSQLDGEFGGLHASWKPVPNLKATALYLLNAPQRQGRGLGQTAGALVEGSLIGFTFSGEFYYQFGENAEQDLSAYMMAARAGYTFPMAWKPSVTAWAEYLSGDGTPGSAFDTLYATNHKFYGELDFFTLFPRDTAGLGLVDVGGQVAAAPLSWLRCWIDYHYFRTAFSDADPRTLGQELDLRVNWTASPVLAIGLLAGLFYPTEELAAIRGVPPERKLRVESALFLTTDLTF